MAINYCSLENLRLALNVQGTENDSQLGRLITACSRWVDEYCEVDPDSFAQEEEASRYYFRDQIDYSRNALYLDHPLLSLTTLTNGDGVVISASDYRLWPLNKGAKLEIRLKSTAYWNFDSDGIIRVDGIWGWSTEAPGPVVEATLMLATWMHQRYQDGMADASANLELGQIRYAKAIPPSVIAWLQPWKDRVPRV